MRLLLENRREKHRVSMKSGLGDRNNSTEWSNPTRNRLRLNEVRS